MEFQQFTFWGPYASLVYFVAAVFVAGVWIGRHFRASKNAPAPPVAKPVLTYNDVPTVRLQDSKRIDRLHKVLSLTAGQHIDLLDMTFDLIPKLRIELRRVEQLELGKDYARIHIELGGATASCGSLAKEVGPNEFLLPRANNDEQRCSILYFHGKEEIVNLLRVKVLHLSVQRQTAEVDVLHVCSQWQD
jgi:hypothetical protein